MWGFDNFFRATGYYWEQGHYWWYALGAISWIFFCYKMGVIKSTIFHLIMFPLILNRWFWLKDAFNIIENGQRLRGGNELPLAAGLMLITIVLYAGFAFSLSKKDW